MTRFHRPCLVCGELAKATRCAKHQAEYNSDRERKRDTPERRARKANLYGGSYKRRRAETLANATHCHICKQPLEAGDRVEADHLDPGNYLSPLAPAHRLCNQRRGDKPLP